MHRRSASFVLVLSTLAALSACAYRSRGRVISPADVGGERARITNYLSAPVRSGQPTEETPAGVPRAAVVDEAALVKLDRGEVCVAVVLRTHVDLDLPLSEWNFRLAGQTAYPEDERVTVRDLSYTGERDVVAADAVAPNLLASLRITEPTEYVYRVFERSARLCAPTPASAEVGLEVERPMDDRRGSWGAAFSWMIR